MKKLALVLTLFVISAVGLFAAPERGVIVSIDTTKLDGHEFTVYSVSTDGGRTVSAKFFVSSTFGDYIAKGMGQLLIMKAEVGQVIVYDKDKGKNSEYVIFYEDGSMVDASLITVISFNGVPLRIF